MDRRLLPHIFLVYSVLSGLIGVSILSFILTVILVGVLEAYKLPQCSAKAADKVLQPHKSCIIAHRGGGHDAPENTLVAMREAKKNGADAVEFDIDFSKDDVAILMHDDTVDRTTDGQGVVGNFTFDQLQGLSASAKHPLKEQFPNEPIPSLEETVKLCLELEMKMYFDVKGNAAKATDAIIKLFKKYPELYENAIVCSFFPQVSYMVKRADPQIVTGLTHRHRVLTRKVDGTERDGPLHKRLLYPLVDVLLEWAMHGWLWYLCGSNAFLTFIGDVSPQVVESLASRGVQTVVWTPNSPHEKEYVTRSLRCHYITDTLKPAGCRPQST